MRFRAGRFVRTRRRRLRVKASGKHTKHNNVYIVRDILRKTLRAPHLLGNMLFRLRALSSGGRDSSESSSPVPAGGPICMLLSPSSPTAIPGPAPTLRAGGPPTPTPIESSVPTPAGDESDDVGDATHAIFTGDTCFGKYDLRLYCRYHGYQRPDTANMTTPYLIHPSDVDQVEIDTVQALVHLLALFRALNNPPDAHYVRLRVPQEPIKESTRQSENQCTCPVDVRRTCIAIAYSSARS